MSGTILELVIDETVLDFVPGDESTVLEIDQVLSFGTTGGGGAPSGPAGGVLGGTYPDPSFAVDMATQAELDAIASARLTQAQGDTRYFRPTTGTTLTDPDVPAAIARDAEVTAAVAAEATDRATAVTAEATARANADALLIPLTQKAAANGVATLDGAGLLSANQIPPLAITDTSVVPTQAAMLALTAQPGDVAIRSDLNKSFILQSSPASTLGNWKELLTPTDVVLSVDGLTGAVSLPTDAAAGTGSKRTLGPGALQAAAGNDARLTDTRTPTDATVTPAKFAPSAIDPVAATAGARTLGTSATQAAAGNDSRLSDARTPTAHAASHASGGTDAVTLAQSQITGLAASLAAASDKLGLTPTAVKTSAYTAAAGEFVLMDTSGGFFAVTLPTTPADGSVVGVKQVATGASGGQYNAGGSDTIEAAGTLTGSLVFTGHTVVLQYKASATRWYVVANHLPYSSLDSRYYPIVAESHADVSVVNSTTETAVVDLTLPAGAVAAGDTVRLTAIGDCLNSSGSTATWTPKIKIGSTTVLTGAAISRATNGNRLKWTLTVDIKIQSTTAQRVGATLLLTAPSTANWDAIATATTAVGYGTAAEDTSTSKAIQFTVTPSAANASLDFVVHASSLEVIKKR